MEDATKGASLLKSTPACQSSIGKNFPLNYGNRQVRQIQCKLKDLHQTEKDVLPNLIASDYCGVGGIQESKYLKRV